MEPPIGPEDQLKSDLANNAISRANDLIALLESIGITDSRIKLETIKPQLDLVDSSIYNKIRGNYTDEEPEDTEDMEEF